MSPIPHYPFLLHIGLLFLARMVAPPVVSVVIILMLYDYEVLIFSIAMQSFLFPWFPALRQYMFSM